MAFLAGSSISFSASLTVFSSAAFSAFYFSITSLYAFVKLAVVSFFYSSFIVEFEAVVVFEDTLVPFVATGGLVEFDETRVILDPLLTFVVEFEEILVVFELLLVEFEKVLVLLDAVVFELLGLLYGFIVEFDEVLFELVYDFVVFVELEDCLLVVVELLEPPVEFPDVEFELVVLLEILVLFVDGLIVVVLLEDVPFEALLLAVLLPALVEFPPDLVELLEAAVAFLAASFSFAFYSAALSTFCFSMASL